MDDKTLFEEMIGRARLTHDKLVVTAVIECVVNSRPLTLCLASDDLKQPLTPAYLLSGRRLQMPISFRNAEDEFEVTSTHLTKRFVYFNRVFNDFGKGGEWNTFLN